MVEQTSRHFRTMTVLENVALGALFARRERLERKSRLELAGEALSTSAWSTGHDPVRNLNLNEQRPRTGSPSPDNPGFSYSTR